MSPFFKLQSRGKLSLSRSKKSIEQQEKSQWNQKQNREALWTIPSFPTAHAGAGVHCRRTAFKNSGGEHNPSTSMQKFGVTRRHQSTSHAKMRVSSHCPLHHSPFLSRTHSAPMASKEGTCRFGNVTAFLFFPPSLSVIVKLPIYVTSQCINLQQTLEAGCFSCMKAAEGQRYPWGDAVPCAVP